MSLASSSLSNLHASLLPPVCVVRQSQNSVTLTLHCPDPGILRYWTLIEELGAMHQGRIEPSDLQPLDDENWEWTFPFLPGWGYHALQIAYEESHQSSALAETTLIVTPDQCFIPESLVNGESVNRIWGPAVQLYAVRSKQNWGMGDLTDLSYLTDWNAHEGANIIGINPLHALSLSNPQDASPYSPSSRLFYNPLYIDIEAIAEYQADGETQRMVLSAEFQTRLQALRDNDFVDYPAVADIKLPLLMRLYQTFRLVHLIPHTPRADAFHSFVSDRGERLHQYALFEALQAHFHREDPSIWGWPVWPEDYRNPESESVKAYAQANTEQIEFYMYLQWLLSEQLQKIGEFSYREGLCVGLYMDLPVGLNRGGSEVWANQADFALDHSIGAPPDAYSTQGQNWGLTPWKPERLRETKYRAFATTLRENMRYAGALRIDHFMALMRLFWIQDDQPVSEGQYVPYAFDEMLGVLALESHRNKTLIIGEDLGTVPDEVKSKMADWNVLSYKVFYFEKNTEGGFNASESYVQNALVTLSTQDLPTFSGFWAGQNNIVRNELGLISSDDFNEQQLKNLVLDRMHILSALNAENLLPSGVTTDPASVPVLTSDITNAVYQFLARTPSLIEMIQYEDVLSQLDQVNLPGTTSEYPNWQRKLSVFLEDLAHDNRVRDLYEMLQQARHVERTPTLAHLAQSGNLPKADIPDATYRFQFNQNFTFDDAIKLIPYLKKLGISHCYASPLLKARAGSPHGYDIIDHTVLNPEIGTREAFNHFTDTLRDNNMALIVDIVPNHMGIGSDNNWWMDVLENGQASEYADYFDIDWTPLKEALWGKVLLPVLGDQYGVILENGELQLKFCKESGRFTLHYYDHYWPINPNTYPDVLSYRLDILETRLGATHVDFLQYQSILTAFSHLPPHTEPDPEARLMRRRECSVTLKRLTDLVAQNEAILEFINQNLNDFNTLKNNSVNQQRLHQLLEGQAYRMAYWRVASDEINYRRFFDINDLAGLRMENPKVFWDTHRFIFELIQDGQIQGLRIDHPDGLYDPDAYFNQLQDQAWKTAGLNPALMKEEIASGHLPLYVVVEKILASYEHMPLQWPVHGTTGYKFGNDLNGLFIDGSNERVFTKFYQGYNSDSRTIEELIHDCKRLILKSALSSELNVLANLLSRIAEQNWRSRDFTLSNLRLALAEVIAYFPVYRTYITPQTELTLKDSEFIDWAVSAAKKYSASLDPSIFNFIQSLLQIETEKDDDADYLESVRRFAMKFQQLSGPVMAKGLEDTCFYRYNRLVSMNEVGGELQHFGNSIETFHRQNTDRLKKRPHAMINTTTHDSKRTEDVRARINVLSELPAMWQTHLNRWVEANRTAKTKLNGELFPDMNMEYLIYQSLIGIWPFEAQDEKGLASIQERLSQYVIKAARESKQYSSWINVNEDYENALLNFVKSLLSSSTDNSFLNDFIPFQKDVAFWGAINSLAQLTLKLTLPGMPDIYQGQEGWDFSLVDPDNRRPINYDYYQQLLESISNLNEADDQKPEKVGQLLENYTNPALKLFITVTLLNYRRMHSTVFSKGTYVPISITGDAADHAFGYCRSYQGETLLIVVPRLVCTLTQAQTVMPLGMRFWGDTSIFVPEEYEFPLTLKNLYTGEVLSIEDNIVSLATLLKSFPIGAWTVYPDKPDNSQDLSF